MKTSGIKVAVVGAGLMGCGIAQVFAMKENFSVKIFDQFAEKEKIESNILGNLRLFLRNGVFSLDDGEIIMKRIAVCDSLEEAVGDADLVVECIIEDMEKKQNLFAEIEKVCPENTILATNTSVMSPTEIASLTKTAHRLVGTHFWNPPYLIPLVEVVKAEKTDDQVVTDTIDILKSAGKHPIRVEKDVPGFVANRLQHALWREAISIVENGIADAKTVDEAIKMSFGMRLPALAPMENADMVGLDLTYAIHDYILKHLENSTEPSPLLKKLKDEGNLGFKTGKGFAEWSPEAMSESKENLTKHLIKVLYDK